MVQTLPVIITLNGAEAILTLAGLGFLGFGIEPTSASEWGYDINKALPDISNGIWWTSVFPGLGIVLVVLGLTMVGESLNETLNPLLRTRVPTTLHEAEEVQEGGTKEHRVRRPDADASPALRASAQSLSVSFLTDAGEVDAVTGSQFEVYPGEVLAVVGESGSGKSVSVRSAIGLLPDTARSTGTWFSAGRTSPR